MPFWSVCLYIQKSDSTATPLTIGAIFLGTTGNMHGTYIFMNLTMRRRTYHNKWTEIPTPEHVIARVSTIAAKDKAASELIFKDRNKVPWPILESIDAD